jgi:hypothetical protein
MKNIKQALKVWDKLRDIPINDDSTIVNSFMDFEEGTDIHDIWHWIENSYNVSIVNDLTVIDIFRMEDIK